MEWLHETSEEEEEAKTSQPTIWKTKASKWGDHMTSDEDDFTFERRRNVGAQHQSYGDWEAILDDNRKVEDDVHPDFMCKIFYFVHHSYFIGQKRKLTETRKVLSYLSLIWSVVDLVWVVVFFSLL